MQTGGDDYNRIHRADATYTERSEAQSASPRTRAEERQA